jgi:hypothetical protein
MKGCNGGLPDINEMVRRLIFTESREIVSKAVQGERVRTAPPE